MRRFSLAAVAILSCVGLIGTGAGAVPRSGGPSYTITDLGTLGGLSSAAFGINNLGQVVGGADLPDGKRHAFRWENGTMTDLGVLPGDQYSEASDINNLGAVCGYSSFSGTGAWDSFVWQNGTMTKLPHLSGAQTGDTSAFAINDARQVVGISRATLFEDHAFLWQNGTMMDLGTLGGPYSIAWDINASGQIIGAAATSAAVHAFLWQNGGMDDLGTLGGEQSDAFDSNDAGQVVGWAQDQPGGKDYQIFLWQGGMMTNLGAQMGFQGGLAEAINNMGQVVGVGDVPFLYTPGIGARNLEELISPQSGWSELYPRDINDGAQVVGHGTINGRTHAFLITPIVIPVVSSWGLLVFALGIVILGTLLLRRRGSSQIP